MGPAPATKSRVSTLAPDPGVHVGSGHCCHCVVLGNDVGPDIWTPFTQADMLHTPDASLANSVIGHELPGEFQTQFPP